jgi:hypothetical protein
MYSQDTYLGAKDDIANCLEIHWKTYLEDIMFHDMGKLKIMKKCKQKMIKKYPNEQPNLKVTKKEYSNFYYSWENNRC